MINKLTSLYQEHLRHLQKNYEEIMGRQGVTSLLIHSGRSHPKFLDDNFYSFKVNPHFAYWIPLLQHPHCFLWVEKGKKPQLFYFITDDFWHKPPSPPQGFWVNFFDIHLIREVDEVKKILGNQLAEGCYIGEFPQDFQSWGLKGYNEKKIIDEVHFLRTKKTAYEVHCLVLANEKAIRGHLLAKALFEKGNVSELDIHLDYLKVVQDPEWMQPYENIVAFNENSAVLHYVAYQIEKFPITRLKSFLIDAGAQFHGYTADITRTYAHKRGPFADLIAAMEGLKHRLVSEMKVDQLYPDNHKKTHLYMAQILLDFKIVKDLSVESIVEKKITNYFFPHGLSHLLGIQVHDVGGRLANSQGSESNPPADSPNLRLTTQITEGHVFTVEPGLYFIDPLLKKLKESPESSSVNWTKIEEFRPFGGIRTEDDVAVIDGKICNLTQLAITNLGLQGIWQ